MSRLSPILNRMSRLLGVQPGERLTVLLSFLYFLIAVGAFLLARLTRDALFLEALSAQHLPMMYVGAAIAIPLASLLYTRLEDPRKRHTVIVATNLLLIAGFFLLKHLLDLDRSIGVRALYIFVEVQGALTIMQFWTFNGDIYNQRQARRLFGIIGAGGVLANVLFAPMVKPLSILTGIEGIIYVVSGLLILCCLLITLISRIAQNEILQSAIEATRKNLERPSIGKLHFCTRHVLIVAGITFLAMTIAVMVDYLFKQELQTFYHGDKIEIGNFLGRYYFILGISSVFIQLVVTGRLVRRLGIVVALSLLPLTLGIGLSAIWLIPAGIWVVTATRGSEQLFRYTINDTVTQLLYLPVPSHERGHVKAFVDGAVKPFSIGLSGLLLFLLYRVLQVSNDHIVLTLALLLVGVWFLLIMNLKGEYLKSVFKALESHFVTLREPDLSVDSDRTRASIRKALEDKNELQILQALEIVARMENHPFGSQLIRLLEHANSLVRKKSIELLSRMEHTYSSQIHRMIHDPDDEVKSVAIRSVCAIGREQALHAVNPFIHSDKPPLKAAAISGLIRYAGLDGILLAAEELKRMVSSPEEGMRLHGARVLGEIGVRNFYHPLLRLMFDPSVEVQTATIQAAARMQSPELIPSLIYKLEKRDTGRYAAETLVAYGAQAEMTLKKVLDNEKEKGSVRYLIPPILARIGSSFCMELLLSKVQDSDEVLRDAVITGLYQHANPSSFSPTQKQGLQLAIDSEIRRYYTMLGRFISLTDQHTQGLLCADSVSHRKKADLLAVVLLEKLERIANRILMLLGLIHSHAELEMITYTLKSDKPKVRARATEALDNLLESNMARMVLPIFEKKDFEELFRTAASHYHIVRETRISALEQLLRDDDNWIVAVTLHAIGKEREIPLLHHVHTALGSTDPVIRESALGAYVGMTDEHTARTVIETMRQDAEPFVRARADHLLQTIGGTHA
jgi:ATP/ADP translocase/HEAT repeat protein